MTTKAECRMKLAGLVLAGLSIAVMAVVVQNQLVVVVAFICTVWAVTFGRDVVKPEMAPIAVELVSEFWPEPPDCVEQEEEGIHYACHCPKCGSGHWSHEPKVETCPHCWELLEVTPCRFQDYGFTNEVVGWKNLVSEMPKVVSAKKT